MSTPQDVPMSDANEKDNSVSVKSEDVDAPLNTEKDSEKETEPTNDEEGAKDGEIKEEPANEEPGTKDGETATEKSGVNGEDIDMEDINPEENDMDIDFELEEPTQDEVTAPIPGPVPITRKDKTLSEFLESMNEYAPIIPDAVTDYYLAKSGFQTNDVRIKRLLALATQKFISDLASDAYQHSRIRSSSSVSSASNPQARAKALVAGFGGAQVQTSSSGRSKIVLTMEDLSSASSEYGLNLKRPDFYR